MSAQKEISGQSVPEKTAGTIDPAALALLTGQVRNLLAFYREIGLAVYPAMPKLRQFLTRAQTRGQQERGGASLHGPALQQSRGFAKPVPSQGVSGQGRKDARPIQATAETVRQELQAFHQEIAQCRQCSSETAARPISGQGSPTPRLLVLGDCFLGTSPAKGLLWGEEEDAMLRRMMTAIGLEQDAFYVTNAVKCPQPKPVQPGSPTEHACFARLEQELLILRPQLICTMGDTATRALLKTKAPLVRLRGHFHTYRYPQGQGTAKLMPTFHPRLLLQYPEMKQAVWQDLQAVQRVLRNSSRVS